MADRIRRPALQLYAADDVLANGVVMEMGHEAFGVHMRLYCRSWLDVGVPSDFDRLARSLGLTRKRLDALWVEIAPAWEERDGRFYCPEQEVKRERAESYAESRSRNGARGGRPRVNHMPSKDADSENHMVNTEEATESFAVASASSTAVTTPPNPPTGGNTRRGAKRVPESWEPRPEDRQEAVRRLGTAAAVDALASFRDHEFRSGRSDWDATWRNWYREEAKRRGNRPPPPDEPQIEEFI